MSKEWRSLADVVEDMRVLADRPPEEKNGATKELDHMSADDLLCEALILLGWGSLVEAFERVDKWYA